MGSISRPPPLRIYFIPFFATGHMLPLLEFSRIFSARGEHVTIITTHSQAKSIEKCIDKDKAQGHNIQIHCVTFPSKELGLPDGLENPVSAIDKEISLKIHYGITLLQQQMESFMQQNPPDCIISDAFYPWTAHFSNLLGIPRLIFDGSGIFAASLREAIRSPDSPHLRVSSENEPFLIKGVPHSITMTLSQLPESVRSSNQSTQFMNVLREAELKSYGRLVNNFEELDVEYTQHYEKIMGIKVWQVGPTCLIHRKDDDEEKKGQRMVKNGAASEEECLNWLNSKDENSVLYVCFGSAFVFSDKQMMEIANGIESSGHKFIWVVLGTEKKEDLKDKWILKEFEERVTTSQKGLILKGFAPQVMILEHPAVGGFMTHCGWNSVVEGVCAGVPMITWPLYAEHFYNEKLITQVHGIGVEVGEKEWTRDTMDSRKNLVSRDSIEEAVRKVMDGGDEALEIQRRAREMGEKSKTTIEEGGSSHRNMTALIHDLKRLRSLTMSAKTNDHDH